MRRLLNQAANAAIKVKGCIFEVVYRRCVTSNKHTDAQAFRTLLVGNERISFVTADCILTQLSEPLPEASGKTIVINANLAFSANG